MAETQVRSVTMSDNRVVDFVGKKKLVKTSDEKTGTVRLDFLNGETRLFTIPQDLALKFAVHGAEQKLGDEIAGIDDIDDAVIAVDELIDRLNAGEWSMRREGSGFAGTSVLARALAELKQKPIEVIKAFLKGKSQAEKLALRASPKVKPIVDRLEAEKASKAASVDTDQLLGEIDEVSVASA